MGEHGWAHAMLWVGMDGHRSMLMVMVWVWVQIRRKMLGSGVEGSCIFAFSEFAISWHTRRPGIRGTQVKSSLQMKKHRNHLNDYFWAI
jgi:hypothetical protein